MKARHSWTRERLNRNAAVGNRRKRRKQSGEEDLPTRYQNATAYQSAMAGRRACTSFDSALDLCSLSYLLLNYAVSSKSDPVTVCAFKLPPGHGVRPPLRRFPWRARFLGRLQRHLKVSNYQQPDHCHQT